MPVTKTAKKALRSSSRKALSNKPIKTRALSAVKTMRSNPNKENLQKAFSALDKAKKKNIFHKGKVSRLKSRLTKYLVKSTGTKVETKPEVKKTSKTNSSSKKVLK